MSQCKHYVSPFDAVCSRCYAEVSKERDDLANTSIADGQTISALRAELAALREELSAMTKQWEREAAFSEDCQRELREARALLARAPKVCRCEDCVDDRKWDEERRAFLAPPPGEAAARLIVNTGDQHISREDIDPARNPFARVGATPWKDIRKPRRVGDTTKDVGEPRRDEGPRVNRECEIFIGGDLNECTCFVVPGSEPFGHLPSCPARDEAPRCWVESECGKCEGCDECRHARDEGPRCPCLQWEPEVRGSRSFHVPGCEYAPACDEGPRCTCGCLNAKYGEHHEGCPARAAPPAHLSEGELSNQCMDEAEARDEARGAAACDGACAPEGVLEGYHRIDCPIRPQPCGCYAPGHADWCTRAAPTEPVPPACTCDAMQKDLIRTRKYPHDAACPAGRKGK